MTTVFAAPTLDDFNGWVDFWRYKIGVNVVPAIYKDKIPIEKWATDPRGNWQLEPIPEWLHNQWKAQNKFKDGMAIVLGNVWHNDKRGHYLACIDTDNELATERISISAKVTLVQQRKSDLGRAHSYFYSPRPVKRKPATSTANNPILKDKVLLNLSPKFEVRCIGDVVYSGKHEGGYYEFVGQLKPISLSLEQVQELEWRVADICKEFGLKSSVDIPSVDLFKEDFAVYEGDDRSLFLKRAMGRLLGFFYDTMSLEEIKQMAKDWEKKHCRPPYPPETGYFERNWKQAVEWRQNENSQQENKPYDKHPLEQDLEAHKNRLKKELSEPDKKKSKKVSEALEFVLAQNNFATFEETDEIVYWDHGVYLHGGEVVVRRTIENMFGEEASIHLCREVLDHVRRRTYHKRVEFDANKNIINMKNGLYYVLEDRLDSHDPNYLSLNQKPFPHDPTIIPTKFGKFLDEVVYFTDVNTLVELMGYTFYRDNPFEIVTLCHGFGGNGKSVLFGVLTALQGDDNVSHVSLKTILERPFGPYELVDKDVNLDSELSSGIINDTAILKKITGRERIYVEQKNQKGFYARLHAKPWFSCNLIPAIYNASDADFRRIYVISFPNTFEGERQDPDKVNELTTETELSGIFNVCMTALRRVLKNKKVAVNQASIEERRIKYEMASNPVKVFAELAFEQSSLEMSDYCTKDDVYRAYVMFCTENNLALISKENLGRKLRSNEFRWEDGQRTVLGKKVWCWTGHRLTVEYNRKIGNTTQENLTL